MATMSVATVTGATLSPRLARPRVARRCSLPSPTAKAAKDSASSSTRPRGGDEAANGSETRGGARAGVGGRRVLLGGAGAALTAAAAATTSTVVNLGPAAPAALALFNKDLDVPITDPIAALAVVFAVRDSVKDILAQIGDFRDSCPAPVFPCDLSQLSVKTSSRVSGPLKRSLPTLSEVYGADPYAVEDILQSVVTTEAMLYANNARVKVDFSGPETFLNLVEETIAALLLEVPEEAVAAGRARYDSCDLTLDPRQPGEVECRLARAVAQGARPTGGVS